MAMPQIGQWRSGGGEGVCKAMPVSEDGQASSVHSGPTNLI
jgi:hypothetical protein